MWNEGGGEMKRNEERMYVRLRRAAFVPSEVSAFVSPILHVRFAIFKKNGFFYESLSSVASVFLLQVLLLIQLLTQSGFYPRTGHC